MRIIDTSEVTQIVSKMCIDANYYLSDDMKEAFDKSADKEESELGKKIFSQLTENLKIAGEDKIPICQDTGMAVVFVEIGQEVSFQRGKYYRCN